MQGKPAAAPIQPSETAFQPAVAREIRTKAAYRVYVLMDEESNILVERHDLEGVMAPSNKFAEDPRGLSHGYEWRLPGFSLMQPPTAAATLLDTLWAKRRAKVWLNESNLFNESAIVQALTLSSAADHQYLDWLALNCRAYLLSQRSDNPWPATNGVSQRWLTEQQFMADFPVGAHDRYVLALLLNFMTGR